MLDLSSPPFFREYNLLNPHYLYNQNCGFDESNPYNKSKSLYLYDQNESLINQIPKINQAPTNNKNDDLISQAAADNYSFPIGIIKNFVFEMSQICYKFILKRIKKRS